MRIIDMQGFCVKLDRQVEFQQWLRDHEDELRASYPEGVEYGGIYCAVFTSEKTAGEYFALDILDGYAALDRIAATSNDPASEYNRLSLQMMEFLDFSRRGEWSRVLLKSLVDATVFDAPKQSAGEVEGEPALAG